MPEWLAPDKAMRQERSLQQSRARSPARGEDKNGLLAAIASCVRPPLEEGGNSVGDRQFGIKVIHAEVSIVTRSDCRETFAVSVSVRARRWRPLLRLNCPTFQHPSRWFGRLTRWGGRSGT